MSDRKIFAVAGRPILHSLSPALFRAAYPDDAAAGTYTRLSAGSPDEALELAAGIGLAGLNVTAPLKTGVFARLDRFDEVAAALGAVNTLVRDEKGWAGFNTDPAGVGGAFAAAGIDLRGKRAVVLGAGGAGRAAAFALRGLGAEVALCNRTDERAQAAARRLAVTFGRWADLASILERSDILVSALPSDAGAVQPGRLRPGLVVLEAAYPDPPLSRAARERGCVVLSGEDWLLRQAAPAFRLFTGAEPDLRAMADVLRAGPKRPARGKINVALVGFMGSGKTAAGRRLAELLGLAFEDSDERVERRTGRSIPDIFLGDGEEAFRREESLALREALEGRAGVVCACGGGGMESAANRALVKAAATVVWLHAPAGVCRSRIGPGTRPLLRQRLRSAAEFEALFRARISCYAEASDIVVGSAGTVELTARSIHDEIRRLIAD